LKATANITDLPSVIPIFKLKITLLDCSVRY